jgi:hypothetical protein
MIILSDGASAWRSNWQSLRVHIESSVPIRPKIYAGMVILHSDTKMAYWMPEAIVNRV